MSMPVRNAGWGGCCCARGAAAARRTTTVETTSERGFTSDSLFPACRRAAHRHARLPRGHLDLLGRDDRLRPAVDHLVLRAQLARQLLHCLIEAHRAEH